MANSLSAAIAVVDPTSGSLADQDGETVFPLPDNEHAASPTGVTGYEIINQVTNERGGFTTITAQHGMTMRATTSRHRLPPT